MRTLRKPHVYAEFKNSNDILHCNKGATSKNYFSPKRIEATDILYNFFKSFYN